MVCWDIDYLCDGWVGFWGRVQVGATRYNEYASVVGEANVGIGVATWVEDIVLGCVDNLCDDFVYRYMVGVVGTIYSYYRERLVLSGGYGYCYIFLVTKVTNVE